MSRAATDGAPLPPAWRRWAKATAMTWMAAAVAICAHVYAADKAAAPASRPATVAYTIATPQLANPLRPLKHLPPDARIILRAAVATVPDPVDTTLGRSFDMDISALQSAFQATGYELDGFALSWEVAKPREKKKDEDSDTEGDGGKPPQAAALYRQYPGVLLFRHENWRATHPDPADRIDVEYFLVFLVGEAPSFGVHPHALAVAARCALG